MFSISLVLVQHWACVRSRSPAPQTRPPPSLYPFGASRSARSSLLPRRGFHYRDGCESVQIGPPVVPEQRSGGRQPPRTCCLFTATPSAHKTGKSQDVSAAQGDKKGGRGVGPGGQAGPGRNSGSGSGGLLPGLAKEVKLTSLKIFFFRSCLFSLSLFTLRLTEKVRHKMSHGVYIPRILVPCGYFKSTVGRGALRGNAVFFSPFFCGAHQQPAGAAPPFTVTSLQTLCPAFT